MSKRSISVLSDTEDHDSAGPRKKLSIGNDSPMRDEDMLLDPDSLQLIAKLRASTASAETTQCPSSAAAVITQVQFTENASENQKKTSPSGDDTDRDARRAWNRSKSRAMIHAELRETLKASNLEAFTLKICLEMIESLEERNQSWKPSSKGHPRTPGEMLARFSIANKTDSEESIHPWATPSAEARPGSGMLFRAWDEISRAQNRDSRVGFLSGGVDWKSGLRTKEGRKEAISKHADWANRRATPFISTTDSWSDVISRIPHLVERQHKKGIKPNTKLTLFNSNARIARKLPILRMSKELKHYGVKTRYHQGRQLPDCFYHEHLFPFSSEPEEIVYTWIWEEIEKTVEQNKWNYEDFYEKVVVPKYQEHEAARLEGRKPRCGTACNCCGH